MAVLREALIPLVLLISAGTYWWMTRALPSASTVFPYVIMGFMAVMGVAIIVKEFLTSGSDRKDDPLVTWRAPALLVLSAGFVAMFVQIGFVPAALIFLCTSYIVLGTKPLLAVIVAASLTGAYYLLFAVLIGMNL